MEKSKLIKELQIKIKEDKDFKMKLVRDLFSDGKTVWLNDLDFSKDNLDLNFSGIITGGNIFNTKQQAKNIDNSKQIANYKILNMSQMVITGNIVNEKQSATYIENKGQKVQTEKTLNVVKKILG